MGHGVFHVQSQDFRLASDPGGLALVSAVADVFVGGPRPAQARWRPRSGRRVRQRRSLLHAWGERDSPIFASAKIGTVPAGCKRNNLILDDARIGKVPAGCPRDKRRRFNSSAAKIGTVPSGRKMRRGGRLLIACITFAAHKSRRALSCRGWVRASWRRFGGRDFGRSKGSTNKSRDQGHLPRVGPRSRVRLCLDGVFHVPALLSFDISGGGGRMITLGATSRRVLTFGDSS